MVRLSVVVITFNEEKNIGRCLASVKEVADEMLVIDSNSADNTAAIATQHGARVLNHPFEGYGQQKNFGTDNAAYDWVLSLDADEELSPELAATIMQVKEKQDFDVYEMPRLTNYCGQWIHHCGWYPDRQTRLYNRTKGRWVERKVHEYWALNTEGKTGLLKGDLLHYSFASITEHLAKIEKYTELAAREGAARGKKASLAIILFSPLWHFIDEYILKRGFLDGFAGYTICKLSAYATFQKYTRIRLYSKGNGLMAQ